MTKTKDNMKDNTGTDPKEKIIVALDFDQFQDAKLLVDQLPGAAYFKVGLQAFLQYGEEIIIYLKKRKRKLFLDLKFKDIPNTVYGAVKSSNRYLPDMLTLHLTGGAEMIRQASEASKDNPGLTLLGVTVLTSLSDNDLKDIGMNLSARDAVLKLCELGLENGIDAFVCSPMEIEPIRQRFGGDVVLVTPGIRPAWSAKGDQKRVFTPKMAVTAGSNYLVVGRPISRSDDPSDAFKKILEEIL
ncbi:MAG: orotidine-5'-phosphate decarboxylase [bacterium]|nr:orotidine-5'-phosphate decarboxylase [bacterium]